MASHDEPVLFDVEEAACRIAVEGDGDLLILAPELRAVMERAKTVTGPDGARLCRARCGRAEAQALRDYFEGAAAALQARGEYDRSTACAQSAAHIAGAVEGHPPGRATA